MVHSIQTLMWIKYRLSPWGQDVLMGTSEPFNENMKQEAECLNLNCRIAQHIFHIQGPLDDIFLTDIISLAD